MKEVQEHNFSLNEEILKSLKEKNISLKDLESKTSLSYSTLHRSFSEKREFTPSELVEILGVAFGKNESIEIIKKYFKNSSPLVNLFSDLNSEEKFNDVQSKLFTDEKTFSTSNLIQLEYFQNEKQVSELLGLSGVSILKNMAKNKVIHLNSDGKIVSNFNVARPSFDVVRKQIKNSVDYHKDSNAGKMKNFVYFGTKLLSKEKRTYVYSLIRVFKSIVDSILHNNTIKNSDKQEMMSLIENFNVDSSATKTEPVFVSMVYDDFKPEIQEVLQ